MRTPAAPPWRFGLPSWNNASGTHSSDDVCRSSRTVEQVAGGGGVPGGLLLSQGEQAEPAFDHFRCLLEGHLAEQFRIPTLIVIADFALRHGHDPFEMLVVSLKQDLQLGGSAGALQFRGHSPFCSSLDTTLEFLLAVCGKPNLGVNFDFFHYDTGPSKFEDLKPLTPEMLCMCTIATSAVCLAKPTTDSDRILPGDGDFASHQFWSPSLARLRRLRCARIVECDAVASERQAGRRGRFHIIAVCLGFEFTCRFRGIIACRNRWATSGRR